MAYSEHEAPGTHLLSRPPAVSPPAPAPAESVFLMDTVEPLGVESCWAGRGGAMTLQAPRHSSKNAELLRAPCGESTSFESHNNPMSPPIL